MSKQNHYRQCKCCGRELAPEYFAIDVKGEYYNICRACAKINRELVLMGRAPMKQQKKPQLSRVRRTTPDGEEIPDGHKWCSKCQKIKPIEDFGINRSRPDGRAAYCIQCYREVKHNSSYKI